MPVPNGDTAPLSAALIVTEPVLVWSSLCCFFSFQRGDNGFEAGDALTFSLAHYALGDTIPSLRASRRRKLGERLLQSLRGGRGE